MQINVGMQPFPSIIKQKAAAVLDAKIRFSRQSSPASGPDTPIEQGKAGLASRAAAELESLWVAGFAAASVVLPSLVHWRSALRLGLGLFLFSILQANFNGGGTKPDAGVYQWVVPAYFWAAITLVLVGTANYVGAVASLAAERIAATLVGGVLGYVGVIVASGNGVAMSIFIMAVGMMVVISASPLMAANVLWTFVIVAFEGYFLSNSRVLYLAISRVGAICSGVLLAMILTCIIFPRTGSAKAVTSLRDICSATADFNALAWCSINNTWSIPKSRDQDGGASELEDGLDRDGPNESEAGDAAGSLQSRKWKLQLTSPFRAFTATWREAAAAWYSVRPLQKSVAGHSPQGPSSDGEQCRPSMVGGPADEGVLLPDWVRSADVSVSVSN